MRHPPPYLYWIAFGAPILIGVLQAAKVWRRASPDTSVVLLYSKVLVVAFMPIAIFVGGIVASGGIMIYLGSFRAGNRVRITDGDYAGKNAVVLKYHGFTTSGSVHLHIESEEIDVSVSSYQIQKIGILSYLF